MNLTNLILMKDNKLRRVLKQPLFYLIILIISIKLIFILTRYHLIIWDEAVYLGMGKWIYSGGKIGIWETIRPIGLPLLLGIFWKMGWNYIVSADIIMMVFSAGAVVMTYLIAEALFNKKIATITGLLTLFSPIFFHNSQKIMTGIPSLFFTLVALYLIIRKKYLIAGLYSGTSLIFRFPSALIFIAINLIFLYEYVKTKGWKISFDKILKYNITFFIVISIYFLYNKITYGSFLEPLILAGQHQSVAARNIDGLIHGIFYYPYTLIITNILLVFALVPVFIRPKEKKMYFILIPLIVFFFYFSIIPHKQPRFALIFLPYFIIIATIGFFNLIRFIKDYKILRLILLLSAILMLFHPLIIDYKLFKTTPSEEPEIFTEYYR